jgi:hypothetical protein
MVWGAAASGRAQTGPQASKKETGTLKVPVSGVVVILLGVTQFIAT